MFKEQNRIWWYMLGMVILLALLVVFARDYVLPIVGGKKDIFELEPYVYTVAPNFQIDLSRDYYADVRTNFGIVTLDLFEKAAPVNVNNLNFLANRGYYDGTKFHRLFPDFLIQGGDRNTLDEDPINDGRGGPGYFVNDEINWDSLKLDEAKRQELIDRGYSSEPGLESQPLLPYTMAMASSLPDTNGSQFFFVLAGPNDPRLDIFNGYFTVVGKVISGADVLERMRQIPVDDPNSPNPRPTQDVVIERMTVYAR
ncbi:MAG: peptidylprolyl isomerase [Candidatus Doudnabacteria bacterium]|nr:peptidylprolyl isomerase [Candidatus Doudnabacteria bacterium]